MILSSVSRRWWIALGVVLALLAVALVALRVAVARLPAVVSAALGPRASVGAIEPGWMSIEVRDLVVRADPKRWPAEFELRAVRVTLRPEWSSLWSSGWRLARIEVEGGYVSMQRLRDGRLVVLTSLLDDRKGDGAATPLRIGTLALRGATLDFFDATVAGARGAPHRLRLTSLDADVGPLALPALDERMALSIETKLDGPKHVGTLRVAGHLTPAAREADLNLRARGVDLVALQPYLLRSGEASVRGGTMDLTLDAKASGQRLHAPGRLTLHRLELSEGGGLSTFAGLPRQAVLAAMSRDGKIELSFTLEGRIDDPKFSINELFAARFAVGLADKLGVSLSGVVEGVGNVIRGLLGR